MILKINEELCSFTFAGKGILHENNKYPFGYKFVNEPAAYFFDPDSGIVCESGTDDAEAIDDPIVFPSVTRIEVQKEYIKSLDDKKLNDIFKGLDDKEYWDTFWQYFDDGGEKFTAFGIFEKRYRINKIIKWCEENNIPYYVDKKDEFIKNVFKE